MGRFGWFLGMVLCGIGLAMPGARAADSNLDPAIVAAETRVALGITAGGFGYRESFDGTSDREGGVLPGFTARASRLGTLFGVPDVYTGVVYDFSGGPLHYDGYLQGVASGLAPYGQTDHARFNTLEVRLGKAIPLMKSVDLIPYVTAGYQNWYRDLGGPGGYGEFYRAALAGAGAKLDVAVNDGLVLSASAEGLVVVGGRVSAPALGFAGNFGASGEEAVRLGADWRLGGVWHAFAGVGVRHYNYAGSGLDGGYYEPPSSTFVVRGEMGVAFGFR